MANSTGSNFWVRLQSVISTPAGRYSGTGTGLLGRDDYRTGRASDGPHTVVYGEGNSALRRNAGGSYILGGECPDVFSASYEYDGFTASSDSVLQQQPIMAGKSPSTAPKEPW